MPLLAALAVVPSMAGVSSAEGLSGFAEFTNSYSKTKSDTVGSETQNTNSNTFIQRYNISLERNFYPTLRLSSGALIEKDMTETTTNGADISSDTDQFSPYLTLTMGNPFINSAIGYARNEQSASSGGSSSVTNILETYTGRVGWRPEGLPSVDILFNRANSYDSERVSHNITTDSYSLGLKYQPRRNLSLIYQALYTDSIDKLSSLETTTLTNAFTGNYMEQFFKGRVNYFANANLADQETKLSSSGQGGNVFLPVFPGPTNGLAAATPSTNPLITVNTGQLTDTPELLGGSAQINIVTPRGQTIQPGTQINIGLGFGNPSTMDTLFVSVTTNSSNANPNNISQIANRFSWDIYTSDNGTDWVILQSNFIAPFGLDPSNQNLANVGFILRFPTQTKRFIKAVVTPPQMNGIPPIIGVNLDSILVTGIKAIVTASASQFQGQKTSTQNAILNTGAKVSILDRPGLPSVYYDLNINFNYTRSDSESLSNYFVSNGLSSLHRFSKKLSGRARVAREDSKDSSGNRTAFSYNLAMDYRPLSTLSHTFTYSGRYETQGGKSTISNSLFLTNTAQLYRGINVNLSGGLNLGKSQDDVDSVNTILTFGANIVPHQTLTLNVNVSDQELKQSGGGRESTSTFTRSASLTASYNPVSAISLFGSVEVNQQKDTPTNTIMAFGGGWSPFRDGALQFSLSYNESITSTGNQKIRSVSPAVRWNIRPGWWLDAAYTHQTIASSFDNATSDSITSSLRLAF